MRDLVESIDDQAIDQKAAFETANAYLAALKQIYDALNTKGGIESLYETATKPASTFEDMDAYLKSLRDRKSITKQEYGDYITTFNSKKKVSEAVAKLWLRGEIKKLG